MAALSVSELGCDRDGIAVLRGVTFEVAAGHALILRGPNGIGKTTLLRTLAGLQPPAQGQISDPAHIAYAAHADGVKATLSVLENLDIWARIYGTNRASAAIEGFDLTALADRPAGQLSAGQRRRLGLARLLVTGRPIWALDEPTVSLDTAAQDLLLAALRSHLAADGVVVISTHVDLDLDAEVLDLSGYKPKGVTMDTAFAEAIE